MLFENGKIKGAIRTDFILSAEIIAITLGRVAEVRLTQQIMMLSEIAMVISLGVHGLMGAIIQIDDLSLFLQRSPEVWRRP